MRSDLRKNWKITCPIFVRCQIFGWRSPILKKWVMMGKKLAKIRGNSGPNPVVRGWLRGWSPSACRAPIFGNRQVRGRVDNYWGLTYRTWVWFLTTTVQVTVGPTTNSTNGEDHTWNNYDCQNLKQVLTGVRIHIKPVFPQILKIKFRE